MDTCAHDIDTDTEYDSESENMQPFRPLYFLHPITDSLAESILQFERPGSWILRENPYVISIRIEEGYIHHTDFTIQLHSRPEILEYTEYKEHAVPTQMYISLSSYLDKFVRIYGLVKRRQIIMEHKEWHQKRQGAAYTC